MNAGALSVASAQCNGVLLNTRASPLAPMQDRRKLSEPVSRHSTSA